MPEALRGVELGDDVLEIGPGPGLTTDVLRGTRLPASPRSSSTPTWPPSLARRLAGTQRRGGRGRCRRPALRRRPLQRRRLVPHAAPRRIGGQAGPGLRRAGPGPGAGRRAGGGRRRVRGGLAALRRVRPPPPARSGRPGRPASSRPGSSTSRCARTSWAGGSAPPGPADLEGHQPAKFQLSPFS